MEISLMSLEALSINVLVACAMTVFFTLYGLPLCVGLYALSPLDSEQVFKRRFAKHLLLFAAILHLIGLIIFIFFVNAVPDFKTFLQDPIALAQTVIFCLLTACAVGAFLIARRKSAIGLISLLALFWFFCQTFFLLLFEFDNYFTIVSQIIPAVVPTVASTVVPTITPAASMGLEPLLIEFWLFLLLGLGKVQPLFFLVRGVLFACMSAFALALVWLVIRRKADDFGRDYYTYAARLAARGAMIMSLALCAFELHVLFWYPDFSQGNAVSLYISIGAQALGACIWFFVQGSVTPMRHKMGMWCGAICVLCATILFLPA